MSELEFLRYFYNEASHYMGPADGDVYYHLKRYYVAKYGPLPKGYELEEDEDES